MAQCISPNYIGTKPPELAAENSKSSTYCGHSHAEASLKAVGRLREERRIRGIT
jgi:hypothetical protein